LVASVYAFGYLETSAWKYPYIVMKHYPFTLTKWIANNRIRNMSQLKGVLRGLVRCLQLIHASGIVHRDLKPDNVFVAQDGHPVLADFGIAWFDPEQHDRLVRTTQMELFGNRGFSAPEQRQPGTPAHPTMDLWALGQLIQWLVTGQPHSGGTRMVLAQVHRSFAPLDPIVEKLLQRNPAERPQSIEQVAKMTDAALK
jgi:serine/threonine-protein kinase